MIVKLAVASVASVAAVAVAAGVDLDRGGSPPAVPTRQVAASGARPDTTSDAEARRMRRIVIVLARQTAAGARCDPGDRRDRFAACAMPALQRAGMGGPMAANVLDAVLPSISSGRCHTYLLGLQAATQAAGEQAHWLMPHMYGPDHVRAQHEVATQLVQISRNLRRAAAAEPADVCRARRPRPSTSDGRARLRRHGRPLHSAVAARMGGGPRAQ